MALEDLSLSSGGSRRPVDGDQEAAVSALNGGGDEGGKAPRLPRWTRQEILVLIQGKRVAENRVRRGRTAGLAYGSGQPEPKWNSVSSYCGRHGVNRGPIQCRKRWSNLAGDFKKIKEWEAHVKDDSESFWVMRNDLRRERKLPGFFDKEVYDILDGAAPVSAAAPGLSLALTGPAEGENEKEKEVEAVFDSGRSAAAEDGLFSDFEQSGQDELGQSPDKEMLEKEAPSGIPAPTPISEKRYQPFTGGGVTGQGTSQKQPEIGSTSHQGKKRKRFVDEGGDGGETNKNLQDQLVQVLERNGRILGAHLEAQNTYLKLDREERKDHADSLVAVLNKLADALGKIADKL